MKSCVIVIIFLALWVNKAVAVEHASMDGFSTADGWFIEIGSVVEPNGSSYGGLATSQSEMDVAGHVGRVMGQGLRFSFSYHVLDDDFTWQRGSHRHFAADARAHVIIANVSSETAITPRLTGYRGIAAGASINELSNIRESDAAGRPIAAIHTGSQIAPAIRGMAGARWQVGQGITAAIDADLAYVGGFRSGARRETLVGHKSPFSAHEITNVVRASFVARISFDF